MDIRHILSYCEWDEMLSIAIFDNWAKRCHQQ